MHYSVCVPALFGGMPVDAALEKIQATGAKYYEFWSWWDQDVEAIAAAQARTGLKPAALCTCFVPLTDPKRRSEYVDGLKKSIEVAKRLGCPTLISQLGNDTGAPRAEQHRSIVEGLRMCAPMLEEAGITLTIEPLNTLVDHPGYYLTSSAEGFEIVREVDSERVKLLFDIYHQQIMEGNLIANLTANAELLGHIHAAGNPGRHELLIENEIHYPSVFAALKRVGYRKAIGLEYFPVGDAQESLRRLFEEIDLEKI